MSGLSPHASTLSLQLVPSIGAGKGLSTLERSERRRDGTEMRHHVFEHGHPSWAHYYTPCFGPLTTRVKQTLLKNVSGGVETNELTLPLLGSSRGSSWR